MVFVHRDCTHGAGYFINAMPQNVLQAYADNFLDTF